MAPPRCRKIIRMVIAVLGTLTFTSFLWLDQDNTPPFPNIALKRNCTNSNNSKFWNAGKILRKGYGRLPFPVENTECLPTAYSTVVACKAKPKFLFFVHTAPGNFGHRSLMRSCLGNLSFSTHYHWTTVFFIGLSSDTVTAKLVEDEASQHGDVVVLPHRDVNRNLTYKFVYGMKWTIENCPSVTYIIKMDDDFVVNVLKLMKYIETHVKAESEFHCHVYSNMYVPRNVKSKQYLSEKEYPSKIFPPYCGGGCVMFKPGVLRGLYNASFSLPFHGIDDVYVTGQGSLVAGVKHISINQLYSFYETNKSGVASGKIMFSEIHDHKVRGSAWESISESLFAAIASKPDKRTKI